MPLQNLFLDTDSLRIGANQLYTQANAVFVGNNLHVGNSILMGVTAGNTQWPVNLYPNSTKLIISANNPLWSGFGGGAIDLRVGTAGGRVGITFSSNINFGSDGAYMYYNDSLPGYTAATASETSVFLLGTWNDSSSSPTNEDVIAIEGPGNIFLNPGMGTSIVPGGTTSWSNTQGNLWVGNNSIKYLAIHEGLQANVTLRAPITFANSANALVFSGASNTSITLRTSPNGILSFDGGAGSLLSISNNILGQIFSVNDISGFPVIEVTANTVPSNTFIQMGQFGSKVSIGTNTTSTSRLTISSNSTVNALEIQGNVGSNTGYFKTPSGTIFSHNSSNELILLNLGQLRFTDGNAWNYDVWGGIKYTSANNTLMVGGPGAPGFTNNAVVSANIVMHNATTGNFMVANTAAINLFVGANGNVGIGNTTPSSSLVVQGAAGSIAVFSADSSNVGMTSHQAAVQIRNRNTANNTYNNIVFTGVGVSADISVQYVDQPNSYGNMRFHTRAADGYHARLRIDAGETYVGNSSATVAFFGANGNIGIGTTSPTEKLYVSGSYIFQRNNADAAGGIVLDSGTSATQFGQIIFRDQGTDKWYIRKTTSNNFDLYNSNTTSVALTISSANNNVGIGNAAPNAKLQVTGTANISGNVALGGDLTVAGNLTISGTTTYINTTTLNIGDNIITLNADLGAVAPSENAGIEVNRGSSANVTFLWDETNDYWAQGNTNITGFANVSTSVNTALLTVGTSFIANTTGVYHTGTVNAASHTISTGEFTANTIGITTTGFVNALSYAAACNQFIANSTGITTTGFANVGTTISIGANVIANTTALFVGNSTVNTVITQNTLQVANATGTTLLVAANGNIGIGNSAPGHPLSVFGTVSSNTYSIAGTVYINENRTITRYGTTHNALGSGSGSRTIDLTLGNFVSATVAGTTTWTFSNPIASPAATGFVLELTNGGSAALTWPAAVKWPGGTVPTLTAAGIDVLTFITDDGGTTWRGVVSMLDSK